MIVLLFHRQRDNLTEHLQMKFYHYSLILIEGIECVTIAPWSPLLLQIIQNVLLKQLYFKNAKLI